MSFSRNMTVCGNFENGIEAKRDFINSHVCSMAEYNKAKSVTID
jgi:hypothetical protein